MATRLIRRSLLLAILLGAGCYSPTLPLPPPVKPEISMTETGAYHLAGGVLPDAQISALNERSLLIDGQQSDHVGNYSFDLHGAEAGDVVELWYRSANDLSPPIAFQLPDLSGTAGNGGSGAGGGPATGGAGEGGASGATP